MPSPIINNKKLLATQLQDFDSWLPDCPPIWITQAVVKLYRVCTAFACMTYTGNKNQSVLSNVMFTRHKAKHKLFWILKHKLFCILKHKLFWILKHRASCVTNIYFLIFLHELQCKLTQGPGWRIKIILQVVVESKLISKIKHYVKLMFCAIHDSPRDTSSFLKNVENILFLAEM